MEAYIDAPRTERITSAPDRQEESVRREEAPTARPEAHDVLKDIPTTPWATTLTFVLADLTALLLIAGISYFTIKPFLLEEDLFASYGTLPLALPLFWLAYALSGLYRAAVMHPAEELRRVSVVTTVVAVSSAASSVVVGASSATTLVLSVAGVLAILIVPACRVFFRIFFAHADWWGAPVVVLGSGSTSRTVIDTLKRWPELGLRPVVLLRENPVKDMYNGVPIVRGTEQAPALAQEHNIPYAIIAKPSLAHRQLVTMLEKHGKFFKRIFVLPDVSSAQTLWTTASSYEGMLGYGVRHYTQYRGMHTIMRGLDIAVSLAVILLLAPVLLVVALLIKMDSPGPVFFSQERMGRAGRIFDVLKFRTMYTDAEERLQEILRKDPERRREYQLYHKLSDDPRVTPIGRWLRRYSLDELPQLWNVLKGEMSLVGPRAYMPSELPKMNGLSRTVLQSRPGITGLWQVSGRNRLSFEERVNLDVHYMQNWSPWLDLYILVRTIPVVCTGKGAQ